MNRRRSTAGSLAPCPGAVAEGPAGRRVKLHAPSQLRLSHTRRHGSPLLALALDRGPRSGSRVALVDGAAPVHTPRMRITTTIAMFVLIGCAAESSTRPGDDSGRPRDAAASDAARVTGDAAAPDDGGGARDGAPAPDITAPLDPCPAGATIESANAPLFALAGSLFANELFVQDGPNAAAWKPAKIGFRVVKDAQGVAGCRVEVRPLGDGGWFFADDTHTDAQGELVGWWVAGADNPSTLRARISRSGEPDATLELAGTVSVPHTNLAPAPYLSFQGPPMSEYSIDATPENDPDFTYYQVIGWKDSYTGLQRWDGYGGHLVIWSLWDVGGVSAEIVSAPPASSCDPFGGVEGTGIQCLFPYPWQPGKPYRFHLAASQLVAGRTDYTLTVTDVTSGTATTVATLRYGAAVWPQSPGTFLEQFAGDQDSCLASEQRMVRWSNPQYRPVGGGAWVPFKEATFTRPYDPSYGRGSLCFNYDKGFESGAFFTSAGGRRVGRPCAQAEVGEPCPPIVAP